MLLSLLATENRDNSTKLRILLSEACVAVYLSLLALALSNSQPNQLYRLVVNSLHSGMWGKVFGGGLRSAVQQTGGNYSRTPLYRHPRDTDALLLRTVFLISLGKESPYIYYCGGARSKGFATLRNVSKLPFLTRLGTQSL